MGERSLLAFSPNKYQGMSDLQRSAEIAKHFIHDNIGKLIFVILLRADDARLSKSKIHSFDNTGCPSYYAWESTPDSACHTG
jgi:hypothetical protein